MAMPAGRGMRIICCGRVKGRIRTVSRQASLRVVAAAVVRDEEVAGKQIARSNILQQQGLMIIRKRDQRVFRVRGIFAIVMSSSELTPKSCRRSILSRPVLEIVDGVLDVLMPGRREHELVLGGAADQRVALLGRENDVLAAGAGQGDAFALGVLDEDEIDGVGGDRPCRSRSA